jgi:hypothetical protein
LNTMTPKAVCVAGNTCRFVIALFMAAFLLTASTVRAQNDDQHPASRVDVYGGYSYFTRQTESIQGYKFPTMPTGVIAQGAYFFTRSIGVEAGGSYQIPYKNDNLYFVQGGPILRYRSPSGGLSIFLHGLAGGVNISGPNLLNTTPPPVYSYYNPDTWGQAYGVGAGIDFDTPWFNHRLALRLAQADYEVVRVNYGATTATGGGNVDFDALRLSAGLVWHFGQHRSQMRLPGTAYPTDGGGPALSCSASPTTVSSGDVVSITAISSGFDPRHSIAYAWTTTGGRLSGSDATVNVDTHGLASGNYTTSVHATTGKQSADCTATFAVAAPQPPTLACAANPNIVTPGQTVTITAQGYSASNRPLTYSFKTSGGTATGAGNSATLSTAGLASGPVTVLCNVVDDLGRAAQSSASFTVSAPTPPPQAVHTEPLCDITFDRDRARPTRVDNEAKACLDSVALSLQQAPEAQLVIVGDAAPSEPGGNMVAAQRAVNTKDYLVTEKGIDPARVEVRTGGTGRKAVQNFLVPSGADFASDYSGSIAVSTAIRPQARIPLTTRHRTTTTRRRRKPVHRTTPARTTAKPPASQYTPPQ